MSVTGNIMTSFRKRGRDEGIYMRFFYKKQGFRGQLRIKIPTPKVFF
jgi:hypothetical protein